MMFLLWFFFMFFFKPEKKTIPGLRERAKALRAKLGPVTRTEWFTLVVVLSAIGIMSLRSFFPVLQPINKSAIVLTTTILFGAATWLAVQWLGLFQNAHWFIFVMGIAFFVLVMTNFIMNVAAIAITMPIALVIAPYLGVAPEVVLFAALTAGMPFLLLVGAAPNAIAYESKQFTSGEFFKYGIPASVILLAVLGVFVLIIWPLMGMPVLTQ